MLPGLGSLLVRRRLEGIAQVVIALNGAFLSVWWMAQLARQWADEGYFPWEGGEAFGVGIAGVLVFGVGWLWSLATSLAVVRAARRAGSHGDTETRRTKGI